MTKSEKLRRIGLRIILISAALYAWFFTQALIGARGFPDGGIADGVHELTAPWHAMLIADPNLAGALLISSSFVIDILGIFLLGASIFGPSIRPFVELLIVFALRQACQLLTALPPPDGMIWFDPGLPSLLVTYGVSTDLFFSGHTAIAVIGAVELARLGFRGAPLLGLLVAAFEVSTVLVLRAHYFMDVFTGIAVALLVANYCRSLGIPKQDKISG